jgi:hypothetical protein
VTVILLSTDLDVDAGAEAFIANFSANTPAGVVAAVLCPSAASGVAVDAARNVGEQDGTAYVIGLHAS